MNTPEIPPVPTVPTSAASPAVTPQPAPVLAKIGDFKNFKLIVAQVKEAMVHPNADKLYLLKVDTGTDVRQIVAGIRSAYTPEQLIGRRVVMIANLEPAVIRGETSQGMLLAATDDQGTCLLSVERDMALGSMIK